MRSDGILKHLALALVIAIAFYIITFSWIQHRRVFKGPWILTFISDDVGRPSLAISEPELHISETLTFPNQKISTVRMHTAEHFEEAVTNLPFGAMLFQDPTFLPGTVTMSLFGHEVELIPRILRIDKKEIPWRAGQVIELR